MLSLSIKKIKIINLFKRKKNYDKAKKKINDYVFKEDYSGLKKVINLYKKKGYSEISLNKCAFSMIKDINVKESIFFAEKVIEKEKDLSFITVYRTRLKKIGYKKRVLELNDIISNEKKNLNNKHFKSIKKNLIEEYRNSNFDAVLVHFLIYKNTDFELSLAKFIFSMTKDKDTEKALNFIKDYTLDIDNTKYLKVISNRYKKINLNQESQIINSIIKKNNNLKDFKASLNYLKCQDVPLIDIKKYTNMIISENEVNNDYYKAIFSILKDIKPDYAIKYGKKYINNCNEIDEAFCLVFALRLMRNNRDQEAYNLYLKLYNKNKQHKIETSLIKSFSKLNQDRIRQSLNRKKPTKAIRNLLPKNLKNRHIVLSKIIFETCKNNDDLASIAIIHAKKILEKKTDEYIALALSNLYFKQGSIHNAINVKGLSLENTKHALKLSHYCAYQKLLNHGFTLPKKTIRKINNKNILYCLHNSLPYHSGGYATRSHGLAKGIANNNWHIKICSRLGYPNDLSSHKDLNLNQSNIDVIDTLNYHRLFTNINQYGVANLNDYIENYANALIALATKQDISIIHAASNFMNGIAANYAARTLGIKSVYEVRGLWEITRMSRQPEWQHSEHFNMIKRLETEAAMHADAVITITYALKTELITRGIDENKITVVSNGVHVDRFVPKPRVVKLEQQLGYVNKVVIGFIGSVVSYEGLEHLVEAASILKIKGINNFVVMIVGDGAVLDDIKELVNHLELNNIFTFTGRVPHDQVEDYYSLVDVAPFPRIGVPVCEMVSPLKPFEAMSMGKAVVSSNVVALTEIVNHGITGLTFEKDSSIDFAKTLEQLISDPELRTQLGRNAREWVVKEKDWSKLATKISNIYLNINNEGNKNEQ